MQGLSHVRAYTTAHLVPDTGNTYVIVESGQTWMGHTTLAETAPLMFPLTKAGQRKHEVCLLSSPADHHCEGHGSFIGAFHVT